MTPLRIVLLGGTGFVGSAFLDRLRALEPGAVEVRALIRPGRQRRELPRFVTAIPGALPAVPSELFFEEPHVIVHFATKQLDHDQTGFEVNVEATRSLLGALPPSARGVIYGSSLSVYGQGAQQGERESGELRPQNPLAHSRAACESMVTEASARRGISAYSLRTRFVFGVGDGSTLPGLLRLFQRGLLIGRGDQQFTIIDAADLAEVLLRVARRILTEPAEQLAVHTGYRRPISLLEIREALAAVFPLRAVRFRLPAGISTLLGVLPLRSTRAAATRLELFGRSHCVSVDRLESLVGKEVVAIDPRDRLATAARALAAR